MSSPSAWDSRSPARGSRQPAPATLRGAASSRPGPPARLLRGSLDDCARGMGLAVASAWIETAGAGDPPWVRLLGRRPGLSWAFAAAAYLLVSLGIGLTGDPAQTYTPTQYLTRNVLYGAVAVGVLFRS